MATSQRLVDIVIPLYVCDPSLYPVIQRTYDALQPIQDKYDPGFVIIDDASPLPHDFRVYYRNEENEGFTKTVNRGLMMAFGQKEVEVVIIMNDDIILTEECFVHFSKMKGLQIASPRDTASSPDDRFGSCWGITREAYELLGLLDEKFRHYFSDQEYYDRAKKAGVEIIKWNSIVLEHPESSTFKLLDKAKLLADDTAIYNA